MTTPTTPSSEPAAPATPAAATPAPAAAPSLGAQLYGDTPAAPAAAEPPAAPAASEPPATPPAATEPPKDGEPPATPVARTAADYTLEFPPEFKANEPLLDKFKELAAEANLDPAVAQKIAGLYAEAATATATQLQTEWNNTTTAWRNEVMALPEFAEDRREATTTMIGRVMDEFSTPEDRKHFNETGLGNNPAFVRLVLSLSNALLEGEPTPPGNPTRNPGGKPRPQSLGQAIYGDQ